MIVCFPGRFGHMANAYPGPFAAKSKFNIDRKGPSSAIGHKADLGRESKN